MEIVLECNLTIWQSLPYKTKMAMHIVCWRNAKGSRKKTVFFLIARPLRPYPPPPSLVAIKYFPDFF